MSTDKREKYIKFGEELLNQHIELVSFKDLLDEAIDELDNTDPKTVLSFGYDFLDDKLTGLFPGELVVIGGESGTGKTTFATNIIYKAANSGKKCAVFALEDRLHDYGIKALYFEIGKIRAEKGMKNYPWNSYRRNVIEDRATYIEERTQAYNNIQSENLYFEKVKKLLDVEMLERALREQTEMGFELFLIDHLHRFDMTKKGHDTKADYIEYLMTMMKQYQTETGARILLIVHYKKLDGKKPGLDSFKDSIAIVQNANYVINLWRDRSLAENSDRTYETEMYIPKSRNPNGEVSFKLLFDHQINDYELVSQMSGTPLSEALQAQYATF